MCCAAQKPCLSKSGQGFFNIFHVLRDTYPDMHGRACACRKLQSLISASGLLMRYSYRSCALRCKQFLMSCSAQKLCPSKSTASISLAMSFPASVCFLICLSFSVGNRASNYALMSLLFLVGNFQSLLLPSCCCRPLPQHSTADKAWLVL